MDIDVTGKQNGLQFNRADWTAQTRPAQTDSTQASSAQAGSTQAAAGGTTAGTSVPKGYESPVVKIDPGTGAAVLSFRDPGSDEQAFQVPSRTALEYERQQRLTENSPKATGTTGST